MSWLILLVVALLPGFALLTLRLRQAWPSVWWLCVVITPFSWSVDLGSTLGELRPRVPALALPLELVMMWVAVALALFARRELMVLLQRTAQAQVIVAIWWVSLLVPTLASDDPLVSWKLVVVRGLYWWVFWAGGLVVFERYRPTEVERLLRHLALALGLPWLPVALWTLCRLVLESDDPRILYEASQPFALGHFEYALALALAAAVALLVGNRDRKAGLLALALSLAMACAFARARSVMLAVACSVVLVAFLRRDRRRALVAFVLGGMVVFLAGAHLVDFYADGLAAPVSVAAERHTERLIHARIFRDDSMQERFNRWRSAARMGVERPWLGWGPGSYEFRYAGFQKEEERTTGSTDDGDLGDAHSEYLAAWSEGGLVGVVGFLALIFAPLLTAAADAARGATASRADAVVPLAWSVTFGAAMLCVTSVFFCFLDLEEVMVPVLVLAAAWQVERSRKRQDPSTA